MKRPALTWKAIRNLEDLEGYAKMEIADHDLDRVTGTDTTGAHAAIEWIKRLRQWKTEQDKKNEEATR